MYLYVYTCVWVYSCFCVWYTCVCLCVCACERVQASAGAVLLEDLESMQLKDNQREILSPASLTVYIATKNSILQETF